MIEFKIADSNYRITYKTQNLRLEKRFIAQDGGNEYWVNLGYCGKSAYSLSHLIEQEIVEHCFKELVDLQLLEIVTILDEFREAIQDENRRLTEVLKKINQLKRV